MSQIITTSILNLLEFEEEDLTRRKSTIAVPEHVLINLSPHYPLSLAEQFTTQLLLRECGMDRLLIHCDTDFHIEQYAPPTGFAATFHSDTTFQPCLFEHPFRIVSVVSIEKLGRIRDDQIERWKRALNVGIRDRSPHPPLFGKDEVNGNWIPSLGPLSWIGLGERFHSLRGREGHCLYVVCTLDSVTWQDVQRRMYAFRTRSYADPQVRQLMDWCREVVKETARRLLHMALSWMQLTVPNVHDSHVSSTELYPPLCLSPSEAEFFQTHLNLPPAQLCEMSSSVWVLPKEGVPECLTVSPEVRPPPEEPVEGMVELDRRPQIIIPEFEVFVDDLVEYPHHADHLLRLSGCCALQGQVARVLGPEDEIILYDAISPEESETVTGKTAQWLHSFPSMANPRQRPVHAQERRRNADVDVTWEDSEMERNPYIYSYEYKFREALLHGLATNGGMVTLQPILVRVTTCLPDFDPTLSSQI